VVGRLTVEDARQLAASRRGNAPAMALLLAVSGWASGEVTEDTAQTAEILSAAGWRVAVASASTPLATSWQQLHRPAETMTPYGGDRP
jgi:phosphoserine phosphatase